MTVHFAKQIFVHCIVQVQSCRLIVVRMMHIMLTDTDSDSKLEEEAK